MSNLKAVVHIACMAVISTYSIQSANAQDQVSSNAAECAISATKGPFTKKESIELCKNRGTVETAKCAISLNKGPFTKQESIELCARGGTMETAECAISANKGPFTKQESIELCKK